MEKSNNSEITDYMVEQSYELGKKIYINKITKKEGVNLLCKIGMNKNSAAGYMDNYKYLIQGQNFTRTTNTYATEYYLKKIYQENGIEGLKNALLALSLHIDYYEAKTKSKVKERKDIYLKYLKLIEISNSDIVFPNEVKEDIYFEGTVKQVLVNNYERNPIARQKCI